MPRLSGLSKLVGGAQESVWLARRWLRALAETDRRRQQELDAIRAGADQQHQCVMAGDDRGVYGQFPPTL